MIFKSNCRYFKGDIPCKYHKVYDVHCENCKYFDAVENKILIVKLGAIGDVIRTTPLLHKLKQEYPHSQIWWISYSPEILPSCVDKILDFNFQNCMILENTHFDIMLNLDKDINACALANKINANVKHGFMLKNGLPAPIDSAAEHKYLTGLFDDVNKANKLSYLEEIFEMCGFKFNKEEYILDCNSEADFEKLHGVNKKIVGLNTGCGDRWVSRLWKYEYWVELINILKDAGYQPLLLGGKQEDEKNRKLAADASAMYLGYFPLKDFINLVNKCDLVVSAVTMAMHLAVGLKKQLILMNNIFNPYEFELYGRGEIVQPEKVCTCYFSPKCKNEEYFCLDSLSPQMIFEAVKRHLSV